MALPVQPDAQVILPSQQLGGFIGPLVEATVSGASLYVDCNKGSNQYLVLTTASSVLTLLNPQAGAVIYLRVKQAAAGSLNITTWTDVFFAGGTEPTVTAGANLLDWFKFTYMADLSKWYGEVLGQDFKA